MNTGIRWLPSLGLLLALAAPAVAQSKFELQAAIEPAMARPGETVTLVLQATVADGWHAYGTLEKSNVPVALKADKWKLGGLELAGAAEIPPGERHETAIGDSFPLPNEFTVKQALKVPAGLGAGEVVVAGELSYQICDENMCLPPATKAFTAKLVVQAAAGAAPAATQDPKPVPGTKPGLKLDPDPEKVTITARVEPAAARAGETVRLVLDVVVDPRWHAYGSKETGNIPVALDAAKCKFGGLEPVGAPQIPPGERTVILGTETFPLPHEFQVVQSLRVPPGAKPGNVPLTGELDYQICDENSCLPPATAAFAAQLVVQDPAGGAAAAKPAPAPDEKLTVRARFDPAVARAGETVELIVGVKVIESYHAYGTRETNNVPVKLDPARLQPGTLELVGEPQIPPGDLHTSAIGEEYRLPHEFEVSQTMRVPAGSKPGNVKVGGFLDYTICDENHCDPAADAPFEAVLQIEAGEARAAHVAGPPKNGASAPADGNPFAGSLLALILACIGGGLFALAMPCTYPMIPITFSFFTKQAEKRGGNVLPLALTYGLGIVLMFVVVGALLSAVIVDIVNHWVTNAVIGAVFLFFAFVLFGWVNLEPPQFVQRAASKASATGGYVGVFFMGATLVISSFTCTAPIVGSLLANVAKFGTGRVAFGMAIFGLTMAAPFVFLSLMPTRVKKMPRSGEWMETLKVSLGFVEVAAALKFVSMVDFALAWQVLPRELFLLLWTTIFGLWAMYLFGILRKAGTVNEGVGAGRMATGMLVSLFATYFLFGALGFKLDFYTTNFIPGYSAESVIARVHGGSDGGADKGVGHVVGKHRIVLDDEPAAVRLAVAEDKLLLYNFTGFN